MGVWLKMKLFPFNWTLTLNVRQIQCVRKVAAHLGYSRVQLKCDGIQWHTGGEVWKVAVHLQKVLEVMSTSVYTGLNFLSHASPCAITFRLSAQQLSESTILHKKFEKTVPLKICRQVTETGNSLWNVSTMKCLYSQWLAVSSPTLTVQGSCDL